MKHASFFKHDKHANFLKYAKHTISWSTRARKARQAREHRKHKSMPNRWAKHVQHASTQARHLADSVKRM